jgi:hypothetical protein
MEGGPGPRAATPPSRGGPHAPRACSASHRGVQRAQARQREQQVEALVGKAAAKRQALEARAEAGRRLAGEVERPRDQRVQCGAAWRGFGFFWGGGSVV